MSLEITPGDLERYIYVVDLLRRQTAVEASLSARILATYPEGTHKVETPGGTILVTVGRSSEGELKCVVGFEDERVGGDA